MADEKSTRPPLIVGILVLGATSLNFTMLHHPNTRGRSVLVTFYSVLFLVWIRKAPSRETAAPATNGHERVPTRAMMLAAKGPLMLGLNIAEPFREFADEARLNRHGDHAGESVEPSQHSRTDREPLGGPQCERALEERDRCERFSGGSDSGSRTAVNTKAISDMIAAPCATRPSAEPRSPSALGRVSSVVMSVVYAYAAEMLPAASPATMRETASIMPVVEKASIDDAAAFASNVISNTGRRPIRSDMAPQIGAPTSCPSE